MSKLDDILDVSKRKGMTGVFSIPTDVKPRVKELILEIIGGDNYAPSGNQEATEMTNRRLAYIRRKVNEL